MRISIFSLVVFGLLGFLTSCADLGPYQMDMTQIIESAKTSRDYNWIAEHYEDTAKDMQSKVEEHKKMLAQYEAQRQYYGKHDLDMESMCRVLIHVYEQATKENLDLADSHRKMAEAIK